MIWLIPLLAQSLLPEACQNLRAERNRFALKACECSTLATHLQRQRCFADEAARLPAATPFAKSVEYYFYDAPPGARFRASSCINRRRACLLVSSHRYFYNVIDDGSLKRWPHATMHSGEPAWGAVYSLAADNGLTRRHWR